MLQVGSAPTVTVPWSIYDGSIPGTYGGSLIAFPGGVPNHYLTMGT